MKALDENVETCYNKALSDVTIIADCINDKIGSIIMLLHKTFGIESPLSWSYDGHSELQGHKTFPDLSHSDIMWSAAYVMAHSGHGAVMKTDIYNYDGRFPWTFLFKSSDEIEEIVGAQIEEKRKAQFDRIAAGRKGELRREELRRNGLNKLTLEEKEALGYGQ